MSKQYYVMDIVQYIFHQMEVNNDTFIDESLPN